MSRRVALVTGASRGIGRAVALELAARGHAVGVNYRSGAEEAKATLALIEERGGSGILAQADVSDPAEVGEMFATVRELLGPVTILVNNAGVRRDALALRMTDEQWLEVLATNLFGAFACSKRALRDMLKARWGRIVNVSSIAGLHGSKGQANYSAAKAGLIGLTKTLAVEVASKGVTVNVVAPGLVATELTLSLDEARYRALEESVPMGRAGTPDDVARTVGFLCSEEASYMSGAVLVTDGAMTA